MNAVKSTHKKRFDCCWFPTRTIDFTDAADVARTPHEQSVLAAQIAATDRQIDRLVYELYGLAEEEIKVVEGGR
jgi:hypothetical protein